MEADMLPGTMHLAVLAFVLLFLWVPFALAGWAFDHLDELQRRAQQQRRPLDRGDVDVSGSWQHPVPLPSH